MPKSKDDSRRRYVAEPFARAAIVDGLSCYFDFIQEVEAMNADGNLMRIDAVSRCRLTNWTFGWEFKKSHLFKSEFADAMRQAVNYRLSRIIDPRLPAYKDMQLPAIAVFPDWLEGMRLLGAQFRVGTMRQISHDKFSFLMGQSAIWHSSSGWTKNAEGVLFGKRGLGSTRKRDC
ncbi:hypothetical protein ACFSCW_16195 [Sphingomonas tabacisoli]|uniref:Uncharacterized protein n=1 Tax=Sphingomonas tabacisoli TaxID=2249466 RepID=A0ABW4I5V8_9SPHN